MNLLHSVPSKQLVQLGLPTRKCALGAHVTNDKGKLSVSFFNLLTKVQLSHASADWCHSIKKINCLSQNIQAMTCLNANWHLSRKMTQ